MSVGDPANTGGEAYVAVVLREPNDRGIWGGRGTNELYLSATDAPPRVVTRPPAPRYARVMETPRLRDRIAGITVILREPLRGRTTEESRAGAGRTMPAPPQTLRPPVGGLRVKGLPVRQPIGRLGTPEEVAQTVVWLCSDDASLVTGLAMAVDGGIMA